MLIDGAEGFQCAGAFSSAEDGLRRLRTRPDVLLLDVGLPGMSGGESARHFSERFPGLQIVMLTVIAERRHVFLSICNGACGYLLKNIPADRLLSATLTRADLLAPEVAGQILASSQNRGPIEAVEKLTPGNKAPRAASEGYSYLNAAGQMGIALNTVRNHIRSIYDKLHVHTKWKQSARHFVLVCSTDKHFVRPATRVVTVPREVALTE
jgi:DNA-binding NarL/FixJ family response regulator